MDKILLQFLAVADEGTITGAADVLHVTQPTLTFNLKKLEKQLGISLFERSSRGVKLTEYGQLLYENATVMRRLYDNALHAIEMKRVQREEGMTIGTGYSWWALFLRDFVLDYARQFPAAPVNVSLGNTLRLMDQLVAGDISLFIGHRIDDLAGGTEADFLEVGPVRDGYFVRPGHPLLGTPRTADEVASFPSTIAFPPEARQRRLLLEQVRRQPEEDRRADYLGRAFTSNSLEACLDYVLGTDAVLRHTDLMAPELLRKGLVPVTLHPGEAPHTQILGLYVLADKRRDKALSQLVDTLYEKTCAVVSKGCDAA